MRIEYCSYLHKCAHLIVIINGSYNFKLNVGSAKTQHVLYSRTSMTLTVLGSCKSGLDMVPLNHWGKS